MCSRFSVFSLAPPFSNSFFYFFLFSFPFLEWGLTYFFFFISCLFLLFLFLFYSSKYLNKFSLYVASLSYWKATPSPVSILCSFAEGGTSSGCARTIRKHANYTSPFSFSLYIVSKESIFAPQKTKRS
jgi:hypothetical protein